MMNSVKNLLNKIVKNFDGIEFKDINFDSTHEFRIHFYLSIPYMIYFNLIYFIIKPDGLSNRVSYFTIVDIFVFSILVTILIPFSSWFSEIILFQIGVKKLSILKAILHTNVTYLILSIFIYYLSYTLQLQNWNFSEYYIRNCIGTNFIAIFVIIISFIFIKYNSETISHENQQQLNQKKLILQFSKKTLFLDTFQVLLIESFGNYKTIYIYENNEVKKEIIRMSFEELKKALVQHENFKTISKSFIINSDYIEKHEIIKGKSYVKLKKIEDMFLVSKKYT